MWKRITGYLAVLILVIYLYFMYDETVISGILVLTVLYPICAWTFLLLVRKKNQRGAGQGASCGRKGKTHPLRGNGQKQFPNSFRPL